MTDTETIEESYTQAIATLRDLGGILRPAVTARYEAPPGGAGPASTYGVGDLTLDIVIDPRRLALSEEVDRTARTLRRISHLLGPHIPALRAALAHWEGQSNKGVEP